MLHPPRQVTVRKSVECYKCQMQARDHDKQTTLVQRTTTSRQLWLYEHTLVVWCCGSIFKSEGSLKAGFCHGVENMAEASSSSGAQDDSEASGGEQEGMFQKGVPVTLLNHR